MSYVLFPKFKITAIVGDTEFGDLAVNIHMKPEDGPETRLNRRLIHRDLTSANFRFVWDSMGQEIIEYLHKKEQEEQEKANFMALGKEGREAFIDQRLQERQKSIAQEFIDDYFGEEI